MMTAGTNQLRVGELGELGELSVCAQVCAARTHTERAREKALLTLAKESGAASEKDALILVEHLHGRLICAKINANSH